MIFKSKMLPPPLDVGLMNKVENGAINGADKLLMNLANSFSVFAPDKRKTNLNISNISIIPPSQ
jgi:hypothetical protein